MKHLISITFAALASLIALPSFAQTTQSNAAPRSATEQFNNPYFTFVYGTVSNPNQNQFTLNRGSERLLINTGQYVINLAPNEPVTVTGTLNPRTGRIDAYSITRSTGANITLRPSGVSVQPPIQGLSDLVTEIRRVQ